LLARGNSPFGSIPGRLEEPRVQVTLFPVIRSRKELSVAISPSKLFADTGTFNVFRSTDLKNWAAAVRLLSALQITPAPRSLTRPASLWQSLLPNQGHEATLSPEQFMQASLVRCRLGVVRREIALPTLSTSHPLIHTPPSVALPALETPVGAPKGVSDERRGDNFSMVWRIRGLTSSWRNHNYEA